MKYYIFITNTVPEYEATTSVIIAEREQTYEITSIHLRHVIAEGWQPLDYREE